MSSTNNFLNNISKAASYFGLSEKRLRAIADGFVRGSLWFVMWALILAAPLFFVLYLIAPEPHSTVDDFARSVVASVIQAAGGTSSFSAAGGVLENAKFFMDAAARPTALTFILAFFAYKRGRVRQAAEVSEKGSESTSLHYGLGLGAGFATLASIATYFVSGVVASTEGVGEANAAAPAESDDISIIPYNANVLSMQEPPTPGPPQSSPSLL